MPCFKCGYSINYSHVMLCQGCLSSNSGCFKCGRPSVHNHGHAMLCNGCYSNTNGNCYKCKTHSVHGPASLCQSCNF